MGRATYVHILFPSPTSNPSTNEIKPESFETLAEKKSLGGLWLALFVAGQLWE
jgi:hypothetical protein